MKFVVQAVLGLSLAFVEPGLAAAAAPASQAGVPGAAHVQAVQDLLGVIHVEYALRGVAARSRFPSEDQRKAVFARLQKMPPAEVHQRLAPALARVISADTAIEMTRFYKSPYGKQVIHRKYNSSAGVVWPGTKEAVPPEEKKERKRAAYVLASKELADAEPMIQHEAFKLVQTISREKR
ncbi:hypothetical protein [Massilia niabensis]|uniref:DUF2059 domain-containing protein n=1 Tax=Massilia niabensis TaxID=544910 RepID=A0ABW0LAE4_9BURK